MVTVIFVVCLGIVFTVLQRINNCHKKTVSPVALFEQDSEVVCRSGYVVSLVSYSISIFTAELHRLVILLCVLQVRYVSRLEIVYNPKLLHNNW